MAVPEHLEHKEFRVQGSRMGNQMENGIKMKYKLLYIRGYVRIILSSSKTWE